MLQYHFECSSILKIPPEVFFPKPKIDSSILRLKPLVNTMELKNYDFFCQVVKQSFAQRRKTLNNNLKKIFLERNKTTDSPELTVDMKARAESLTVQDFVNLANYLY